MYCPRCGSNQMMVDGGQDASQGSPDRGNQVDAFWEGASDIEISNKGQILGGIETKAPPHV